MDLSGERRLPAARHVLRTAISDDATLADSMPSSLVIAPHGEGHYDLTFAGEHDTWRTRATSDAASDPARSVLHLTAPPDATRGFGGRVEVTMADDGVFTRLLWRISTDLPDGEQTRVENAFDHILTHIGQRAATPAPVAAQGLAGAAAAIVNAAPAANQGSPLQVIARTLAGMPRDATIGGAAFILVVLFVVGIL